MTKNIETLMQEARDTIAVNDDELAGARRRRDQAADALKGEFPGCRVVPNGSLAHGDANTPLTDWDLVVVVPDPEDEYGPGKRNSGTLKERARDAIKDAVADEYPKLTVTVEGQKRAVLVRYSDPVTPGTPDFTGDVICAIDHPDGGLHIPCYETWDRSHPEEHNRIVRQANADTSTTFSRAVRLLKHWNKKHSEPMCSWHIKVLAAEAITRPMPVHEAMLAFFDHAADAVSKGDTPDPAGVGPDIKTVMSRTDTVKRLKAAADNIRDAVEAEADGRHLRAQQYLSSVLPEIVPAPDQAHLDGEDAARNIASGRPLGAAAATSIILPKNRGWAHG